MERVRRPDPLPGVYRSLCLTWKLNSGSACVIARYGGRIPFVKAMTSPNVPDRPMRADARRNRERIVQAARELFAECGPEAQMDDLATRAGVGVGTVYRHFPTKEAVMGELLRQRFADFAETARAALDEEGDSFEIFAGVLRSNAEAMADDAATQRALANGGLDPQTCARDEFEELMRDVRALIARAHAEGTLRPDFDAEDIPTMMCGVCATMAHYASFDWRRHLEMLLDGLRTQAPVAAL